MSIYKKYFLKFSRYSPLLTYLIFSAAITLTMILFFRYFHDAVILQNSNCSAVCVKKFTRYLFGSLIILTPMFVFFGVGAWFGIWVIKKCDEFNFRVLMKFELVLIFILTTFFYYQNMFGRTKGYFEVMWLSAQVLSGKLTLEEQSERVESIRYRYRKNH